MKRNTKRIPALLLCLCLCLALLPAGGARAVTLQGVGTAENPYLIGTAEELFAFADIVNGTNGAKKNTAACARLTANVDLTGKSWVPMGNTGSEYHGTFEGDGFSVKGMTVDITSERTIFVGFFGYIDNGGLVQNLAISGSVTAAASGKTADISAGGVAGCSDGTISACRTDCAMTVTTSGESAIIYAGGILGNLSPNGTMADCSAAGSLTAKSEGTSSYIYVGGVVGINNASFARCLSTCTVTASDSADYAGGVAGIGNRWFSECFWLSGTAEKGVGFGTGSAVELTAEQLTDQKVFEYAHWDFKTVWFMGPRGPMLRSLYPFAGAGTEGSPYEIASAEDWAVLAALNMSAGKFFRQTADFTTDLMVGSEARPFEGSYDGGGHTLTFNADDAPADCAPFRYVQGAAISHLRTAGTIRTGQKFAAGLAADVRGKCTVEDCRSDVTIESTVKGDGTHGGFVGVCLPESAATFRGCVFTGRLLGPDTTHCGGFVGFNKGALTFTECLFAPAELTIGGSSQNFARAYDSTPPTLNSCCYLGAGLSDRGSQVYSVTAGEDLALSWPELGEPKLVYETAGYTVYGGAVMLDDTLLHSGTPTLTLDLTYTGPLGSKFTLRLSMPGAANVQTEQQGAAAFRITFTAPEKDLRIGAEVNAPSAFYADPLDQEEPVKMREDIPVVAGDLTELTEEWYLAYGKKTLSERLRVSGNVNLILADGAVLTAPCGVDVPEGSTLTIWGQDGTYTVPGEGITTLGTGALAASTGNDQAAAIGSGKNQAAGTVVINGGVITAKGNWGAGIGSGDVGTSGAVTVNEGCVIASGRNGSAGIGGGAYTSGGTVTVTGGYVKATGSTYGRTGQATPGIGAGRPRTNGSDPLKPGKVTITGGVVVAIPGAAPEGGTAAQAIGVNLADEKQVTADSLALGAVRVYAPNGVKTPAAAEKRAEACRNTTSARIEACRDHPLDDGGLCRYCGGLPYHDPTDEKWPEKACPVFTEVTGGASSFTEGWYAVRGSVKTDARIRVSGQVHLILVDGAKLEAAKGIHVPESAGFTVWGQTKGSGELKADGEGSNAGIGGSGSSGESSSGTVTVNGGSVTAVGGKYAAGIGGGHQGIGTVTVNGGTVTAVGGKYAAGIGGGSNGSGNVTVNGGSVNAVGGERARAIGSGYVDNGKSTVKVYSSARVMAGKDESSAGFVPAADRVSACKDNLWARIEPCHPHANAGGVCRWCGASGGLTVTREGDTLTVKCRLPEEAQVTVTAACYDASGRFLICAVKDAGARKDFQFNVTAPQSAGKWKIFVTDEKGRPLAEAWEE